jgi:hypothetical protein
MQITLPAAIAILAVLALAAAAAGVLSPAGSSLPGRRYLPVLLGSGFGIALAGLVIVLIESRP